MKKNKPTQDLMSPTTIFRIGLALVLGAIAFLLRYSIDLIGPEARLGLAVLVGAAMLVVGTSLSQKRKVYGNLLQGGGAATLYLSAFAVHQEAILNEGFSLVALVAVSAILVGLSVREDSEALAVVGLGGAMLAPFVLSQGLVPVPGGFGVTVSVVTVAAVLYLRNNWKWAFGIGAWSTVLSVLVGVFTETPRVSTQIGALALMVGVWGVSLWVAHLKPADNFAGTIIPVSTTVVIPVVAYLTTILLWEDNLSQSVEMAIGLGMAAIHLIAMATLGRTRIPAAVRSVQAIPAMVIMMFTWMARDFEATTVTLLISLQAAGLMIAHSRTRDMIIRYVADGIYVFVNLLWSSLLFMEQTRSRFETEDVVLALVVVCFGVAAWASQKGSKARFVYSVVAASMAVAWAPAVFGELPSGEALITATWATIGIVAVVAGKLTESSAARNSGLALLMLVVAKVVMIDTAEVSQLVRILVFAGLGSGLLGLGYWLGNDKKSEEVTTPAID